MKNVMRKEARGKLKPMAIQGGGLAHQYRGEPRGSPTYRPRGKNKKEGKGRKTETKRNPNLYVLILFVLGILAKSTIEIL